MIKKTGETFFSNEKEHFIEFCIAISLYWNSSETSLPCLEDIRVRATEEYHKFIATDYLYIDEYINAVKPNF